MSALQRGFCNGDSVGAGKIIFGWGLPSVLNGVGELAFFAGFHGDGELDLVRLGFGEGG